MNLKKDRLATYRKRAINARFLSLADNNKNINVGQEEWILQLPVCKVADTRLANVLYNQDVRTVKDLLEIVSGRGWKSLLRIEGVGKTSYYHLLSKLQMIGVIAFSWAIAFFEYSCQIPANRIGFIGNGGPFTLMQLKVIQEVITLVIFTVFTTVFFKGEALHWNHLAAFVCLIAAVYFVFMK